MRFAKVMILSPSISLSVFWFQHFFKGCCAGTLVVLSKVAQWFCTWSAGHSMFHWRSFYWPIYFSDQCILFINGCVTTRSLRASHKSRFLLVLNEQHNIACGRKGGNPLVLSFQKCFIHWCETHRSEHV